MKAFNSRSRQVIASNVIEADTALKRMKGLLGKENLPAGEALLLRPCKSVHTIGMKFPIDILFLGKGNKVVGAEEGVLPYRFSSFVLKAKCALELPAGTIASSGTELGDIIEFI